MVELNIEQARFNMVEQQVRPWDVLDQRVLDVLAKIPREAFVPEHLRALAFTDTMLPIGNGEVMLEPKLEARILQELTIHPSDKVLEIGTGSGYMTALLASLAGQVYSIEIDPDLLAVARERLARHAIDNVVLMQGNGLDDRDNTQTYDVIVLTGSVPSVPHALKERLQTGGRLFAVVGEAPVMEAMLITRPTAETWHETTLFETVIPALREIAPVQRFVF